MEQLPNQWCIRANNHYEANIIAKYFTPLSIEEGWDPWDEEDALSYYGRVINGKYGGGNIDISTDFTEISFSEFTRLVLNKTIEPTYEIY